ncbi:MAG: hypothetical protein IJ770_05390 [Alphaproteobacteria bacterium]|nr:hypothetical protein [Alphaproteobacteria bacterium]
MDIQFSLSFFRKHFRIPSGVKLCWCILVERNEDGSEHPRLGVMVCGTSKVIDVAARQFAQIGLPTPVSYEAYVARRSVDGDEYVFTSPEDICVRVPDSYVRDIYFRCVYSEEMMNQPLI